MMNSVFANGSARVLIVEESGAGRQLLSDCVRSLGFMDVRVVATGEDALGVLEVEQIDWILTPLLARQAVNALHLLKLVSEQPELQHVRTSLIVDAAEEAHLNAAFTMGLMSCHTRTYLRDEFQADLKRLLAIFKAANWRASLVAAEYLRRRFIKTKAYAPLVSMEKRLLDLYPGSPALLLRLGEAQLVSGEVKAGIDTIKQAGIIDQQAKEFGQNLIKRVLGANVQASDEGGPQQNALGCDTCVVIDPDTAVLSTVKGLLESVGVAKIQTYDDGKEAWKWLSTNPEPSLILQEWRISGLPGPLLLQRLRQHGHINVPVVVMSSVIKPIELPLLREMGVDSVVAKPFGSRELFKSIIWSLQQAQSPTEQKSLERKMRKLLEQGKTGEAERLRQSYAADSRIPSAAKKAIDAEFAFYAGRYRVARDLGIETLRLAGESLVVLNLIGKSLLKLGDHAAALKFFEKANNLSPLNLEHLCNMAVASFESGAADNAEFLLSRAKDIDSGNNMVSELACQHAIIGGKTDEAKKLMGQLGSVAKVVGYMNNRAVALTKSGRYDEGIQLYQQTADSLPGEWSETHDIVAYNMGLAYARYGDLDKAIAQLKPVVDREKAPLHGKAQSLSRRITTAHAKGLPLPLHAQSSSGGEADDEVAIPMVAALEIRPGDVCLRGIVELAYTPEDLQLMDNPPRYRKRSSIDRRETMP